MSVRTQPGCKATQVARPAAAIEASFSTEFSAAFEARYSPPAGELRKAIEPIFDETTPNTASGASLSTSQGRTRRAPSTLVRMTVSKSACAGATSAVLRGRGSVAPATVRYHPAPGDQLLASAAPLTGGFFKLATLDVMHRRFDGAMQGPLRREVLVGVDAALVLPYDPVRDRVLLVEQFRVGVARRQDANPWCLEPVAGIVDAGETPQQAALREAAEEAGLYNITLRQMFSIYPSPGSSTDHFYCYLGLTDLPDLGSYQGGLASEAEDLRLHVLSFDAATALMDSGEINAGPLVAMLLWLLRHRDGLRCAT